MFLVVKINKFLLPLSLVIHDAFNQKVMEFSMQMFVLVIQLSSAMTCSLHFCIWVCISAFGRYKILESENSNNFITSFPFLFTSNDFFSSIAWVGMYSLNVNNKNYQEKFVLFPFSNSVENLLVFPAWAKIIIFYFPK